MKYVRTLALLLATLIALSAFAGCGGQTGTDDGGEKDVENGGGETPDDGGEKDDDPAPVEKKLVITDTFYPQYTVYDEYDEMKKKVEDWFFENLEAGTLFSVECGSDKIDAIRSRWEKNVDKKTDENGNTVVTAVFEDKSANMRYTLEGTLWHDYPAVDYVVWAENVGTEPSAVIKNFRAVDSSFEMPASKGYTLHTSKGSLAKVDDFELLEDTIVKGAAEKVYNPNPNDGRSTSGGWPYFDVIGKDCGILLAVGWTGIWEAGFSNDKVGEIKFRANQMHLNASLFAGEKIRSPRIVLEYFDGDFDYGHNVWRKLVIEHYTPNDGSEDRFVAPITINFWGGVRESYCLQQMKSYYDAGLKFDAVWFDAGWYADYDFKKATANTMANDSEWAEKRGWYEVNPKCFPSGSFMKIANLAHANGTKVLLWWMIEDGKELYKNKFSLGVDSYYMYGQDNDNPNDTLVLNLASDEVLERLLAYFDCMFEQNGLDWVRVDNGSNVYRPCADNDARVAAANGLPEGTRLGVTENKHILNYYKLWDELAARHPGFVLDNCASGGRRLDIEAVARGVALWRTDYYCGGVDDPESRQAHSQWLSLWVPLSSAASVGASSDNYAHRSRYSASCGTNSGIMPDSLPRLLEVQNEMYRMRPYWYGSFYPLLDINYSLETWNAYELYRDDWQKGIIVIIRREKSQISSQKIKLKGLFEDRDYLLHNMDDEDTSKDVVISGKELMEKGVAFSAGLRTANVYEISLVLEEE